MIQCGLPSTRASPQTRGLAGGCQPPHAWPQCNGRDAGRCSWRFVACPDNQTLAAYMPCSLRGIGFAAGARSRLRAWKQPEETAFPGIPSAAQARNEGKKHAIVRRRNRWSANTCTPSAHHPPASCMLQAVHSPEPGRAAQHRQRPQPTAERKHGSGIPTDRAVFGLRASACEPRPRATLLRSDMPAYSACHARLVSEKTIENSAVLLTRHKNIASRLQRLIPDSTSVLLTH